MTVEWYTCPKCGKPCSIKPLSKVFDPEGKKFGGVWFCQTCNVYYPMRFLSYDDITELKNGIISIKRIEDKE